MLSLLPKFASMFPSIAGRSSFCRSQTAWNIVETRRRTRSYRVRKVVIVIINTSGDWSLFINNRSRSSVVTSRECYAYIRINRFYQRSQVSQTDGRNGFGKRAEFYRSRVRGGLEIDARSRRCIGDRYREDYTRDDNRGTREKGRSDGEVRDTEQRVMFTARVTALD